MADTNIQASGGDYTDIAAHWADQPSPFTSDNRGLLADESFTHDNVSLGGKTPDGFLVTYTPQAGKGFKDTVQALFFSTTGARLIATVAYADVLHTDNAGGIGSGVAFIGLQAKNTSPNYGGKTFLIQGGNLVQDCIGESDRGATNFQIAEDNSRAVNCLATSTRDNQAGFVCSYGVLLFNDTAIDLSSGTGGIGFQRGAGVPKLVNCCSFGAGNIDFTASGWNTASKNNGSDSTNAPGADPQDNVAFTTATFVSITTDFKLVSGSALIRTGDIDTTHAPQDIFGNWRAINCDIGAHEFQPDAVRRGRVTTFTATETTTTISFAHTVDSDGTDMLRLCVALQAAESVTVVPTWNSSETFTLVNATTASGNNNDQRHYWYELKNPTAKADNIALTVSSTVTVEVTVINYIDVDQLVTAADNFLSADVNDAATSTSVHASAGASGESTLFGGGFKGADGDPATDNANFKILARGTTGTSNTADQAFFVADKLGGAPSAITVTWPVSDENASQYIEIKKASAVAFLAPLPFLITQQAVDRASLH